MEAKKKGQAKITCYSQQSQGDCDKTDGSVNILDPYKLESNRQKQINEALVKYLIVGCSLPLSLVDNPRFRTFMKVMDPR